MIERLRSFSLHFSSGRLGRHLSLSFVQVLADSGSMMLLTFLVARIWGPELFGLLGLILVGVHLITMVVEGLTTSQMKIIAEQEALHPGTGFTVACTLVRNILMLAVPVSIALGVASWLYLRENSLVAPLDFVVIGLVCFGRILRSALEAAQRALRRFTLPAVLAIIISPIHLVVAAVLVFYGAGVTTYLVLLALAQLLAVGFLYRSLLRGCAGSPPAVPADSLTKVMYSYGAPLMFRGLIGFLYIKVNIPLIEQYAGLAEVGEFRLAEQFLLIPMLASSALVSAMAPRVAAFTALNKKEELAAITHKAYLTLFAIMGAFTVFFYFNRTYFTFLFPDYEVASIVIQLFALTLIVRAFAVMCSGALLVYGNHGKLATAIAVAGALLNLAVVWFLLHRGGGAIEAAMGTTIVHIAVSIFAIAATHRVMSIPFRLLPMRSK